MIAWSFTPPASAKPVPASWKEILMGLDLLGLLIAILALLCYLLAMQWGGITKPWDSGVIVTLLVLSSLLGLCFFVVQFLQKDHALLVPRILSSRVIIGVSLFAFFQNGVNFFFCYYLPIYFQAIDGFSAAQSGLYNLPLIFGACFFAVISGMVITIWDRYTFYMAVGSALCTIAAGLLFTLDERSRLAQSIGYQLLLGAGQGWAIQVPVIVGQAFSEPDDISATTAVILFFQMTGGAICISAGQSLFTNRLLYSLRYLAPQLNASEILRVGASDLRQQIPADQLSIVLEAYMVGITDTFALGVALAGCAFVCSWIAPISRLATLRVRAPPLGHIAMTDA